MVSTTCLENARINTQIYCVLLWIYTPFCSRALTASDWGRRHQITNPFKITFPFSLRQSFGDIYLGYISFNIWTIGFLEIMRRVISSLRNREQGLL